VKVIYALESLDSTARNASNVVGLYNNTKTVGRRCKTIKIEHYERFHGASRERNSCLKVTFHQDTPLSSLEPIERRRSFLFGAPGVDTSSFDDAVLRILPQIFENLFGPEHWKTQQGESKPPGGNLYRSWLINYSGQAEDGSCIRFNFTI